MLSEKHGSILLSKENLVDYLINNKNSIITILENLEIIQSVLKDLLNSLEERAPQRPLPAVPIERSITPNAIICLEDGKHFKSMRKHLKSAYEMTPEQYRKKWNLPDDYPMVAPEFSLRRSKLSKSLKLGRKSGDVIGSYRRHKLK
jgi:predicted transcriptional regulator